MKSKIFNYLIIFLAIGSIATECNEETGSPQLGDDIIFNVKFTVTPETGHPSTTFNFEITEANYYNSTTTSTYDITLFQWDFDYTGTGQYDWDTDVISDKTITHEYSTPGTFIIVLKAIVDEEYGKYDDNTQKLVVVTDPNTPPIAGFEGMPTNGTAPLIVYFTDQSTNNPTSWQWDFGNGESSTEQSPSYTYNDAGTYTVKLTATNDHGSDDEEKVEYISVTDGSYIPCPGLETVVHGNKTYNTVLIGEQCWFRENLNIGDQINASIYQKDNGEIEKWCYDNVPANCETYGGLYQWDEMMQYNASVQQGICPPNWHIPDYDDFEQLSLTLGGNDVAGGKLKAITLWLEPNTGATNESGFTALPGGYGESYDEDFVEFKWLTYEAVFYGSYQNTLTSYGSWRCLYINTSFHSYGESWLNSASSVRCIKNP